MGPQITKKSSESADTSGEEYVMSGPHHADPVARLDPRRWKALALLRIETRAGPYFAVGTDGGVGAGIARCTTDRPLWLHYVEVERIDEVTDRARRLGASVSLEPHEGSAGRGSVVTAPDRGEIALWQPKESG